MQASNREAVKKRDGQHFLKGLRTTVVYDFWAKELVLRMRLRF